MQDKPRASGTLQRKRVRIPWPEDREFRILSIDGGGIRGILPAAVLSQVEKEWLQGASVAGHFDLIAGTSTGGIIALGLAAGLTAAEISRIYVERGREIFARPGLSSLRKNLSWFVHKQNTDALHRLVDEVFADKKFGDAQTRLCIPAADGKYGEVYVFKTPHHTDYKGDWKHEMAHIAKSTSAAPTYFKPVSQDEFLMLDGGIWASNPILVAVIEALTCFDIKPEQVRVLSLGCVEKRYRIGWMQRKLGGQFFWAKRIIDGCINLQSQSAVGQAGLLLGRDRILRIDSPPLAKTIDLDDWSRAHKELPEIAVRLAKKHGQEIKDNFLHSASERHEPFYRVA